MKKHFKQTVCILLSLVLTVAVCCSCNVNINIGEESADGSLVSGGKRLTVHFLDVGQGDSIFAELPDGKTMLIDAGENYHGAGIIDYINKAGYDRIDYLVATHPHSDHIGSMPYIVRNIDVGVVYMPDVTANTNVFENLVKSVKSRNIKMKSGKAGTKMFADGGLSAVFVAPVTIDESDLNNCSLVILLTYGKRSFLLTGDAELKEMKEVKTDIRADVLKAGHHGSRTSLSKSLIEQIRPDVVVISCGADNEYGHPHEQVLQLIETYHCSVYRTDLDQTVIAATDGSTLTVSTGNPSVRKETTK